MSTFIKLTDGNYIPSDAIALNKNTLLTDKVTMYSGGNDTDGYWIKFSNGFGAFLKTASVTFNTSYNANAASFYRWVCDGSTNTAVRDTFIPKGIRFISEPMCWMFASNGISPDGGGTGVSGRTSININGISCDTNDTTNGYVPRTFCLNVNDPSLTSCDISCIMFGSWKTIFTPNGWDDTFIAPADDKKFTSDSIAFSNSGTTLKDMMLKNTIEKFSGTTSSGTFTSGYVQFTDGLKIAWTKDTTGTMTASSGAKGYIKSYTPAIVFPCEFSFPPAVFVSSTTYRHIPMSVYNTSTTNIGKITFSGTNETTSATIYILAVVI